MDDAIGMASRCRLVDVCDRTFIGAIVGLLKKPVVTLRCLSYVVGMAPCLGRARESGTTAGTASDPIHFNWIPLLLPLSLRASRSGRAVCPAGATPTGTGSVAHVGTRTWRRRSHNLSIDSSQHSSLFIPRSQTDQDMMFISDTPEIREGPNACLFLGDLGDSGLDWSRLLLR